MLIDTPNENMKNITSNELSIGNTFQVIKEVSLPGEKFNIEEGSTIEIKNLYCGKNKDDTTHLVIEINSNNSEITKELSFGVFLNIFENSIIESTKKIKSDIIESTSIKTSQVLN